MYTLVPINDIEHHDEYLSTCKCNPSIIIENGEIIIVHNSFDRRENNEILMG